MVVAWIENLAPGVFGPKEVVSTFNFGVSDARAADFDDDGDLDVLVGSEYSVVSLVWFENLGGGAFGAEQTSSSPPSGVTAILAADVTGDGLVDAVAAHGTDESITWSENLSVLSTRYCISVPSSTGSPAVLVAHGLAHVAHGNLRLQAAPVPDEPGVFFHGAAQSQVPFGNGFLCLSGNTSRGAVVLASGQQSEYEYDNTDTEHSLVPFIGATRYFQYWFRDPLAGGSLMNLSDALSIVLLP